MKIVFVGDSLVSCTNVALAATWPEIAAKKLGFTAVNHAAGGRLTITTRATLAHDTSAGSARHVCRPPTASVNLVDATGRGSAVDTSGGHPRRLDSLVYRPGVRLTDPARVIGAKPPQFARWMFDLLGAAPGDQLDDLYPGSGGILRAWELFSRGTP